METESTDKEIEGFCNESLVKTAQTSDDEKILVESQNTEASVEYFDIPMKLTSYKKAYRAIKLANGLTAILISDVSGVVYKDAKSLDENEERKDASEQDQEDCDETDCSGSSLKKMKKEQNMAECGISVGVGNLNDPPGYPGLARLLEHTMVMGSKECPQHFSDFANNRGGWYNAYTSAEKTTFKFAIPDKFLRDALQRFAGIIGCPLIEKESVARVRRQFVTLCDDVADFYLCSNLQDLWQCRYRAHNITVAIEAKLPLDTLEKHVNDTFSILPNDPLPNDFFGRFRAADLISIAGFEKCYGIQLVNGSNNKIEFNWTMPPIYEPRSSRCIHYILSIIRHKGKGSLISYLRKKNWCLNVSSEIVKKRLNSWLLALTMYVTKEGSEKTYEITRTVYSYLNLLRKEGPQERIYNEIIQIEAVKSRFYDEVRSNDTAFDLCETMDANSPAYYANINDDCFDVDRVWIKACIDALIPENGNIMMFDRSNKDKSEKVEPWFKTKYTVTELSKKTVQYWKLIKAIPEFHLPEANVFITKDFSLIPTPEEPPKYPVKIQSDVFSEVWYKPRTHLGLPICHINVYYISPLPLTSVENATMLDIFVGVLRKLVFGELYPATVAGLNYNIQSGEYGLIVKVNGYNEKLPLLLGTITKYIANCYTLVTRDLLKTTMKNQRSEYYYERILNSRAMLEDIQLSIQRLVHWTSYDKYAALPRIEFDRFRHFAKYFSECLYVQCLVEGNMAETDVLENVQNKCLDVLVCRPLFPGTRPQLRTVEIPLGTHCCRIKDLDIDGSCVVANYYQFEIDPIRLSVLIELLEEIQKFEPDGPLSSITVFGLTEDTDLCPLSNNSGVCGYTYTHEWPVHNSPEELEEEIENKRRCWNENFKIMSEQELNRAKKDLLNNKMKIHADINLAEDVDTNWSEIIARTYGFDRLAREIEVLKGFTIEEMRSRLLDLTALGPNLRKLSVQAVAIYDQEKHKEEAEDIGETETNSNNTGNSAPVNGTKPAVCPLKYVAELPADKTEKPGGYYITDIDEYKSYLTVLPLQRPYETLNP